MADDLNLESIILIVGQGLSIGRVKRMWKGYQLVMAVGSLFYYKSETNNTELNLEN
jgi:hypothetical protein